MQVRVRFCTPECDKAKEEAERMRSKLLELSRRVPVRGVADPDDDGDWDWETALAEAERQLLAELKGLTPRELRMGAGRGITCDLAAARLLRSRLADIDLRLDALRVRMLEQAALEAESLWPGNAIADAVRLKQPVRLVKW